MDFTAGITLQDGRVLSVDVVRIDAQGLTYAEEGHPEVVSWADVKAVMLATTDHMLESGGYLMSMSQAVREREQEAPYDADGMRRFAIGLLLQAAPRLCPRGEGCGLKPGRTDNPPTT